MKLTLIISLKGNINPIWKHWGGSTQKVSYSRSHQGQSLKTVDCAQVVHPTVIAFANVSQDVVTGVTMQGSLKV